MSHLKHSERDAQMFRGAISGIGLNNCVSNKRVIMPILSSTPHE